MIHRQTKGVFVIAATPFSDNGALDLDSARAMTEFYLELGVDGLTILGIMGEAQKLTQDESRAFANAVLTTVAGRVPVLAGVSGSGLDNMAALSKDLMALGCAGVMVAPMPGLNTDAKQRGYFAQVCKALGPDIPVCLQDYPQTTGVTFSAECLLRIFDENSQIVMLKHEDWPGLNKLTQIRAGLGQTDLSILTGNAGLFLPLELSRGADGAMTGFAYPEMMVDVVRLHQQGREDEADDIYDAYLPLIRYEQQLGVGLAVRKDILHRRGILASPHVRKPGPGLSAEDCAEMTRLIHRQQRRLEALA